MAVEEIRYCTSCSISLDEMIVFEVGRHYVGRVALSDVGVGINDRLFDHCCGLAGQDFVQVGTGDATRARRSERVAATAAVVGEDLGAGTAGDLGWRSAGNSGVEADVGGDVLEILARDDVGGHRDRRVAVAGPWVLDLGLNHAFDRVATLARSPRSSEGVVEVGTDLCRCPRLRKGVADAAFLDEQNPATLGVSAARAAARCGQRHGRQGGENEKQADWVGELGHTARSAPESICPAP